LITLKPGFEAAANDEAMRAEINGICAKRRKLK